MLYVKEETGEYLPASKVIVFKEAHAICNELLAKGPTIASSHEAKEALSWKIRHHNVEVFACQFLDSNHKCLGYEEISKGTINRADVYPREVVKAAFQHDAAAVIFVHNHPSGNPKPSEQDIVLTNTLIDVLKPLQIRVLDHLVVGDQVVSMADHGLIKFSS